KAGLAGIGEGSGIIPVIEIDAEITMRIGVGDGAWIAAAGDLKRGRLGRRGAVVEGYLPGEKHGTLRVIGGVGVGRDAGARGGGAHGSAGCSAATSDRW